PSLGYFAVSLEQLARIDDVVTGQPRRWAGGEWRDAMTVLAEEGCPIHQSLRRRIVHRSADDCRRFAAGIAERPRPTVRHDDVILDHSHGLARCGAKRDSAQLGNARMRRCGDHARPREPLGYGATQSIAAAIGDDDFELQVRSL